MQPGINKQFDFYRVSIIGLGCGALVSALRILPTAKVDLRFVLLMAITVLVSSRAAVRIPRINANVTVSDTFIFLMLLLYGGGAGVLLAAIEGLFAGMRISKRPLTVMFNSAMMVCSTFFTIMIVRFFFGPLVEFRTHNWSVLVAVLGTMALAMFAANTILSSIGVSLKERQSPWLVWRNNYLWLSITYIVGAAVAGALARTIDRVGLSMLVTVTPVVAIVYFTYQRYLDDIRTTSAQAEQAERARAEAAERHVEELNVYIAEQQRISQELETSKEHFRHAAFHDVLTGLPNRAMFSYLLMQELNADGASPFAVLFLDLDRFKNINDSLGHAYGDKLLVCLAQRLRNSLRPSDILARFGGDEFAILLKGIAGSNSAAEIAERIQLNVIEPFDLDGHSAFTSASIGIAMSADAYGDAADLLRDADIAMYRAKENGKRCYAVYDETMHDRAVLRLRLESDLREAIERGEFCIYYQPIVHLETRQLAGFEALVRWQHPTKGMVAPTEFIPLAEETGLIVPIGSWVLEEACRQMQEWRARSPRAEKLRLSVNLSSKQVAQTGIASQIIDIVQRTGIEARLLNLEITESVVMDNDESANQLFKALRAVGVQLSLDDFGTGYSSLSCLRRFPVNQLKIDRFFVSQMTEGEENVQIVKTIVELARISKMQVVAEGIETNEHLAQLQDLKCEYGQGYLFSQPVDQEQAEALIIQGESWLSNETDAPVVVAEPPVVMSDSYAM